MKKSLALRLFVVTSIFLLILISGTMIFQSLFFEKFYLNKKMSTLEKNVKDFKLKYSYNTDNYSLFQSIQSFEQKNNAKLAIFSASGDLKFLANPDKQIDPNMLKILNSIFSELSNNPSFTEAITKSGNTITTIIDNKELNTKNIVCVSPISSNKKYDNIIIAISPFQTIEEASSVIREFYIYVFIAAFIMIILLSLIYSNMISKPLIKINKNALKMARMDFSEPCIVDREDEIGNLAETLNFLSSNLSNSLNELKDSNEKLKQDIEKERELERMRKDFIAGVSHELKTPISLIEGYAEGLKDNIAQGEARDFYIDVIIDEAQKMGTLVSDMLDLSQLESGNFKLHYEEFSIDELINSLLKKYSTFIKEKNISLNADIDEKIIVLGDSFRIEQVLVNFISNALRHTPANGKLAIYTKSIEKTDYKNILPEYYKSKNLIFIEIENSGEKIPEEEMKSIWDKFYKIDKSRSRTLGGTGLGLAIVSNILKLHNSIYGVRNTDLGVKFYFSLEKL